MKLYRNNNYPTRWYAFGEGIGWVMFPAEAGGWEKREPARGIDPIRFREMPLLMAQDTGIPGAPAVMSGRRSLSRAGLGEAA